jgi:hypothetical protein
MSHPYKTTGKIIVFCIVIFKYHDVIKKSMLHNNFAVFYEILRAECCLHYLAKKERENEQRGEPRISY